MKAAQLILLLAAIAVIVAFFIPQFSNVNPELAESQGTQKISENTSVIYKEAK